jgi:hypothetical protein
MDNDILIELRKINQQLSDIKDNTSKTSMAFNSFIAGLFHSIGYAIGFLLLTLVTIYLFSYFGWDKMILQAILKPFSQLLPGRL